MNKVYWNITKGLFVLILIMPITFSKLHSNDMRAVEINPIDVSQFEKALANGKLANEAFARSHRLLEAWLKQVDPATGLLPRNLTGSIDIWNAKDSAADNYPFLVISSFFTDQELFLGQMQQTLLTEAALTSRLDRLPDDYSFTKGDFVDEEPNLDRIMFGSAEYVKDGLITIVELLGATPWQARMMGILDDMWKHAHIETPWGQIVSTNSEVNGEMLQVLSRVYWMTGDEKYLEYAIRLGDYYLLGEKHPTRDFEQLRLRDHGNEIASGLTELYTTLIHINSEKTQEYQDPLYEMLDRILEVGRNEDGLFYNVINPQTGEVLDNDLADTFGYVLYGYHTVYQLDGVEPYREAVIQVLNALPDYQNYDWERGSADGDADAIEGALNLYNREPVASAGAWMDQQIKTMWNKQDSADPRRDPEGRWENTGIIEGWHGDGNFARTSTMYALWKTQGTYLRNWREDVIYGATKSDNKLFITITSEDAWDGLLAFDRPRHIDHLNLPFDWPRINQYSEWFIAEDGKQYVVHDTATGEKKKYTGKELQSGIKVRLDPNQKKQLILESG